MFDNAKIDFAPIWADYIGSGWYSVSTTQIFMKGFLLGFIIGLLLTTVIWYKVTEGWNV